MSVLDAAKNMSYLTLAQVIERDMFQERLKSGKDLFLNEFFYPYLQGYDSVAMDVDLEVGGSDQLFNMMTGRHLMHKMKRKNKFVMTMKLITDASGKKIGKTEGNAIAITGEPAVLYGQIMSLPDEVILPVFESCTNLPLKQIPDLSNPMVAKKQLAWQIVCQFNNKEAANNAEKHFETTIQHHQLPSDIPEIIVTSTNIIDVLVETHLAASKSAARRLIDQGGVKVNGEKINNLQFTINKSDVLSVGATKFVKVV
jgi:tyrosyl-tRNA synthetase